MAEDRKSTAPRVGASLSSVAGSDSKRPGVFASDDERAQAELERQEARRRERERTQTPAHGVPIYTPEADDFTPITDILAIAEDEHERELIKRIMYKFRNSEARQQKRIEQTEGGQLRAAIDAIEHRQDKQAERITDISGKSGDNGKLGELRRRVDAWTSKMWWFVTALVGMLSTAAVKLVLVTRAFDAVEARSVHNAELIKRQDNEISLLRAEVMAERAARISRRARDERAPGTTSESREAAAGKD